MPYQWEIDRRFTPDGKWEGVKILVAKPGNSDRSLPASSHTSFAYMKLNNDGTFHTIRFYDKNHAATFEISYKPEPSLSRPGKKNLPVLHYHVYDPRFSMTRDPGQFRSDAIKVTKAMRKHFRKYFKGLNL